MRVSDWDHSVEKAYRRMSGRGITAVELSGYRLHSKFGSACTPSKGKRLTVPELGFCRDFRGSSEEEDVGGASVLEARTAVVN